MDIKLGEFHVGMFIGWLCMCKVWLVNSPDGVHLSILSTNCHRSWSGPKPGFPGILSGAATDYGRRKCNNKISCAECVMSCGPWGTTSLKSPHISLHKPISKDLSFVDTALLYLWNYSSAFLLISSKSLYWPQLCLSINAFPVAHSATAVWCQRVILDLIEQLQFREAEIGWLLWTKEALRGYRDVCVWVGGAVTKTLHNKIFLVTFCHFMLKKKKKIRLKLM